MPVDATLIESWAAQITEASGYTDVQHTVELTGTCPDCTHTTHTDNTT
jgi:Fur family ferric uptake transcriptional regulator